MMSFISVRDTIDNLLKDNNLIYCADYIPNDSRLNGHIFCVQNKIMIIVSGTCGDIDDIDIYMINSTDINFMTDANMYLFAHGPRIGGSDINGVYTIKYSSIEDKDLYEKMKLSTHEYSSDDIFDDNSLQIVMDKLHKCLFEQGLIIISNQPKIVSGISNNIRKRL
jgi:hypothetical protein